MTWPGGQATPIGLLPPAGGARADADATAMMDAVRAAMPPDSVDRMDDVIAEIARREVERAQAMLGSRGFTVAADDVGGELTGAPACVAVARATA